MTDHVKDQLCARIEELEKEKLELNEQLDVAQRECDEAARDLAMEQEHHQATRRSEEALAAHVERLREALNPFASGGAAACISRGDYSVMRERIKDWMGVKDFERADEALRETPETSLARLKAQWQVEALGHVLAEVLTAVEADTVRAHLRNAMRKLRRQAEGDKSCPT